MRRRVVGGMLTIAAVSLAACGTEQQVNAGDGAPARPSSAAKPAKVRSVRLDPSGKWRGTIESPRDVTASHPRENTEPLVVDPASQVKALRARTPEEGAQARKASPTQPVSSYTVTMTPTENPGTVDVAQLSANLYPESIIDEMTARIAGCTKETVRDKPASVCINVIGGITISWQERPDLAVIVASNPAEQPDGTSADAPGLQAIARDIAKGVTL